MKKYLTIGCGDQAGYDRTAPAIRDAAHAQHDERVQDRGAIIGIAGFPVQVQDHGRTTVETSKGLFLTAALPLAGFALTEAESFKGVAAMVSKTPCAVPQGVIEVGPREQTK